MKQDARRYRCWCSGDHMGAGVLVNGAPLDKSYVGAVDERGTADIIGRYRTVEDVSVVECMLKRDIRWASKFTGEVTCLVGG